MNWEIRTDVCAPPCVKQIASKSLPLYSAGSAAQCSWWPRGVGWRGRSKREGTDIYIWLTHFIVQQKLTHCKATIIWKKKNKNKNTFPLSRGKKSLDFRWEIFPLGVLPLSPLPLPTKHSPGAWKLDQPARNRLQDEHFLEYHLPRPVETRSNVRITQRPYHWGGGGARVMKALDLEIMTDNDGKQIPRSPTWRWRITAEFNRFPNRQLIFQDISERNHPLLCDTISSLCLNLVVFVVVVCFHSRYILNMKMSIKGNWGKENVEGSSG